MTITIIYKKFSISCPSKDPIISLALQGILYNADYDLNEMDQIKGQGAFDKVYEIFKHKFQLAKSNPNIYITDFKCGVDSHG